MIRFNVPPFVGKETEYVKQAIESMHICGDGEFTKKCNEWIEQKTGTAKALLTTSCTHALEMAALLRYLDFTDRNAEGLPVALHFLTPETIPVLDDFSLANMGFFLVNTWYKDGEKDPSEIRFVLDAFEQVLSHEPHYVLANFGRSIYHFMTGDYEKADEEVLLALEFADQNRSIEEFVDLVDEKLLAHYEKCIAENPGDVRSAIEAGWCYLRKDNSDKALELLKGIVPDEENEYSYYNLYARCYIKNEQIKEAEPHLLKWQSYLLPLYERKQAGEELTAEENKRLERLGYSYYLLALSRKEKGEPDEAFALMDIPPSRGRCSMKKNAMTPPSNSGTASSNGCRITPLLMLSARRLPSTGEMQGL